MLKFSTMKTKKNTTFLDLLKSIKPSFYSELFCRSKYRGYHIRGKVLKNAFFYNPTLFDISKNCIATVELEFFAILNDAYFRKKAKITDPSNFTFQGETPSQLLNIISQAVLNNSTPTMTGAYLTWQTTGIQPPP